MTFQRILVSAVMTALAACELDAGQAASPIEVASATVTTNASSYVVGEPVTITWSGLPGNALDWVEYLPVSGDDHNPTRWAYTGGATSGSVSLEGAPSDGAYVARAFLDDSYVKLGESAQFTVGDGVITATRIRQFFPTAWGATGTPPTLANNPVSDVLPVVWRLPTDQTVRARIPIEIGKTITSIRFEVYGDNVVSWFGGMFSWTDASGSGQESLASNLPARSDQPAQWQSEELDVFDVGPQLSGATVEFFIFLSGGSHLYMGAIEVGVR